MKFILYAILCLAGAFAALYLGSFTYMSMDSRKARGAGLLNGRLRPCPGTPNCVLSEEKGEPSFIEPLQFSGNPAVAWAKMKTAVLELGGRVENETENYLWATFQTSFWHFTDDLELRMDADNKVIHVRSASRVGKGDLGANRKRVEQLRSIFNKT